MCIHTLYWEEVLFEKKIPSISFKLKYFGDDKIIMMVTVLFFFFFSFLAFNMDTVGNLTFLLKAVHFRERTLQRGLVARIYYKVKIHCVIIIFSLLTCV